MEKEKQSERPMRPLSILSDKVNHLCEMTLFVLMIAMVLLTTFQIFCRLFSDALIWSEELTRFMLIGSSLIGATVAFKKGSHIAITFLVDKMGPSLKKAMAVLVQLISIFFFVVVGWYGYTIMGNMSFQTTPALGISMSWVYLMYPVFSVIVLIHLVDSFFSILRGEL